MSSPTVTAPPRWLQGEEEPGPAAAIEELLKLFAKAARAHQLYLHNNPTYQRALELLRQAFAPVWAQVPELTLTVTDSGLLWDGRPMFHEPERTSDTLPWLLYKDGVRELRLLPGIEQEEIERLLGVLRDLRRAAGREDDAVTLLWEQDFAFLRYRYVEPALDDPTARYVLADQPGRRDDAAPEPEPVAGIVDLREFDGATHFLSAGEIEYLRDSLTAEYAHDLPRDVVAMLLDVFELEPAPATRDEVCDAMEQLVAHYLVARHYGAVATMLREVQELLGRVATIELRHRERLGELARLLSTPEGVAQLLDALDLAEPAPPEEDVTALLGQLRTPALEELLERMDALQAPRLRTLVRATVDRLALSAGAELVRLVGSRSPTVAREAVRLAGAVRSTAAVSALGAVLGRRDDPLRAAAAHALAEIGSSGALQHLTPVLGDADREVRMVAVRAVGARGVRAALPRLEELVKDRRLRSADLSEQMAVFEAYGALCGDAGVSLLDGLLNGRSLLGRRHDPSVRACAAVALGRVGSAAAREALRRAADEKEPVVRTAVQRAMRAMV